MQCILYTNYAWPWKNIAIKPVKQIITKLNYENKNYKKVSGN